MLPFWYGGGTGLIVFMACGTSGLSCLISFVGLLPWGFKMLNKHSLKLGYVTQPLVHITGTLMF